VRSVEELESYTDQQLFKALIYVFNRQNIIDLKALSDHPGERRIEAESLATRLSVDGHSAVFPSAHAVFYLHSDCAHPDRQTRPVDDRQNITGLLRH